MLNYKAKRSKESSVMMILRKCLGSNEKLASEVVVDAFIRRNVRNPMQFWNCVNANWIRDRNCSKAVFATLKSAGYEGLLPNLWESVYGKFYPNTKKYTARCRIETSGFVYQAQGQTLKIGSHKNNH